jgi:hypothetical protein
MATTFMSRRRDRGRDVSITLACDE